MNKKHFSFLREEETQLWRLEKFCSLKLEVVEQQKKVGAIERMIQICHHTSFAGSTCVFDFLDITRKTVIILVIMLIKYIGNKHVM